MARLVLALPFDMNRIHDIYRPKDERKGDWHEVERALTDDELKEQTSRCMNCGQPFCHAYGCPLGNLVPDQNRAVAQGNFKLAYELLSAHSDFPEFTSRICPALCEASCVHGLDEEAVMVRQSEKRIIEAARSNIGGLLRYGIPCFKLEKSLIDRRRKVLEAAGIRFVTDVTVGRDVSADWLAKMNDAVVIAIGTPAARDLKIPGRELGGIHLALELLEGQNRFLTGEIAAAPIDAKGKHVLVIGGGDTGSDCVGTSIRQGAASVTQIEIMPKPPDTRDSSTPWPLWPYMLRTSSSHKEGCERRWNLNSLRFLPGGSRSCATKNAEEAQERVHPEYVSGVEVETVEWEFSPEGRPVKFHAVAGTKEVIKADLVFLAMGFTGVQPDNPIIAQLGLSQTPRTALVPDPARNIYCVGDCASGASLVVRALASGKTVEGLM